MKFEKGHIPWIKGKKLWWKPKNVFKKGMTPWNKGKPNTWQKNKPRSVEVRIKIGEAQRGSKNHAWKGGISPLRVKIYNTVQWQIWRNAIFNRDDYKCRNCGVKGGRIEADHIKKFSTILIENKIRTIGDAINCVELWDINNGRTLCRPCHLKTDTYGNRKPKPKSN